MIPREDANLGYRKRLLDWLFIISGTALTGLMTSMQGTPIYVPFCMLLSGVALYLLAFKFKFANGVIVKTSTWKSLISGLFSFVASYNLSLDGYISFSRWISKLGTLIPMPTGYQNMISISFTITIGVMVLPAVFIFFSWFLDGFLKVCRDLISDIDRVEKLFLLISGILFALATVVIFNLTNVFYSPATTKANYPFDIIYTSDSGELIASNAYLNVASQENDIRQPLFGLFALPFAVFAKLLSYPFYNVPQSYPIILNIIQVFLLQISLILVSRMLRLKSLSKLFFLIMADMTYPVLLFSLVMEQYIFSIFWLILFIHAYLHENQTKNFFFIAAAGSTLTSAIVFPLITYSKSISTL